MQPDNRLMERSGLFDAECLFDRSGNDSDIGRMFLIYRWLRVHQTDPPRKGTISGGKGHSESTGHYGKYSFNGQESVSTKSDVPVCKNRFSRLDRTKENNRGKVRE